MSNQFIISNQKLNIAFICTAGFLSCSVFVCVPVPYCFDYCSMDMEQQTGSKREKEYVKIVYCHPAYLTYMQSTSREMLDWMKHKLESRLLGEISITSDIQMTPPLWQKAKN